MSKETPQARLTPELIEIQQRWLTLQRPEQDKLYAREFAEPFARLFAALPLYGAPEGLQQTKPKALVSVLGLSWQPVALMTAWCRPERLLLLGTEESSRLKVDGEGVLEVIARVGGIDRGVIETRRVGDPGEADIYRAVRDFLRGARPREVFIDPTGGKKSMSAAAALAGFLAGAPLVYVDYAQYHGPNRIPVAGTEFPRLLANPLEVLGDLELRDVFAAFHRSDYDEAGRLAKRLAERLYEPREAETIGRLAAGYAAWDRFDFAGARKELLAAQRALEAFSGAGRWVWAADVQPILSRNLCALEKLAHMPATPRSTEEGLPLVLWYLAAAQRMLDAEKTSLAALLIYAAMERYFGLYLRVEWGLDEDHPDYSRIADQLNRERFDEAGKKLVGAAYQRRELAGPLNFTLSAQLVAALAPQRLPFRYLGPLQGLAVTRNHCEFEHGFLPKRPEKEKVAGFLRAALEILAASWDRQWLDQRLNECRFAHLPHGGDF